MHLGSLLTAAGHWTLRMVRQPGITLPPGFARDAADAPGSEPGSKR